MDGRPMTPETQFALAGAIEAAVRATPGVRNVYRSGSLVSNLLRAGAAALGAQKNAEPIVGLAWRHGGVAVEASIGVDFGSAAAETLRSAQEAIENLLRAEGVNRREITLTVAYVHPREAS